MNLIEPLHYYEESLQEPSLSEAEVTPLRVVGPGTSIEGYIIYSASIFTKVIETNFLLLFL